MTANPIITNEGHNCWNLDNASMERTGGAQLTVGQYYTDAVWVYWRPSDSGYRTLFRPEPNDHSVIINANTKSLGMYSNRGNGFEDSGYDIDNDMSSWQLVIVTGHGTSATSFSGT